MTWFTRTTWGLILVIIAINYCNAAKILGIFPTPSYSHQQPMLALSRALAAKGHNLTVITPNLSKEPLKNHREIDISYAYAEWKRVQEAKGISLQHRISPKTLIGDMNTFLDFFTSLTFNSPNVINFIKEVNGTKFDLILCESLFYSSLLGFREITGNPPVIGLSTLPPLMVTDTPQGNPIIPSYMPFPFLAFSDSMTFYERFYNLLMHLYAFYTMEFYLKPLQEDYLKRYFGNVQRTAEELENDKSLVIVSSDLSIGYPKPLQPNTVYVGPMHIVKPEPLPQDLQKWIDESVEGVIYFSLGSNMQGTSVPEHIRAAFIKAFKQFPKVRILWKWEADTKLPGQPDNVLVKKWLPQQSIFAHPKVRLFISQVGQQSFQEATYYGIPILGIPMFADQDFNSKKLVKSGAGLSIDFTQLSFELIYEKLNILLTNRSYKENMMRQSLISKDKQMSPVDNAVWWTEYVLRHNGAPHLRPAALDLTWYQYFLLDILTVLIILLLSVSLLMYFIFKSIVPSNYVNKVKRN